VQLSEDGNVEALSTIDHAVQVSLPDKSSELFRPGVKNNVCGDERKVSVPMKIRFEKNRVVFHENRRFSFDLDRYRFEIKEIAEKAGNPVFSCG
jgi:hypothetical protein